MLGKEVDIEGLPGEEHEVIGEEVPRTGYQIDPLEIPLRAAFLVQPSLPLQGILPIHL